MGPNLGTAYVKVAPNMTGMQGKVASGFKGAGAAVAKSMGNEAAKAPNPFGKFFTGLKNTAGDIGKVMSNEIIKPMGGGIAKIGQKISGAFEAVGSKVSNFISPVTSRITSAFGKVGDGITRALSPITSRVSSIFTGVSSTITGTASSITAKVTGLFSKAANGVTGALSPITSRVSSVFSTVTSSIGGFLSPITQRISNVFSGVTSAISSNLSGTIGPMLSSISEKFSAGMSALGGMAAKAGTAIAVGLGAGAVGLGALTVKALNAGAELEQQLGGAEAVFGEYSRNIIAAADDAYTNAGLSQNEFLQGANKMGSLFQGAGFDVKKSMEMSSESMQRASDIASIMGIDTTSALEAVTGMAKGNFTMMDNLGVAMNDTAIGAYAAAKGINKTTAEMSIQEKVGLAQQMFMEKTAKYAGNYAKENDTLAGSINTTKKAFQDFMSTGNVTGFVNSLVNTIKIAVPQIIALLPQLVDGLVQIVDAVVPALSSALPQLIPALIKAAQSLIMALVNAMPTIVQALLQAVPTLISAFIQLFLAIIQALPKIIETIVNALPELITAIVDGLTNPEALTAMIMGTIQLFLAIVKALPQIIVAIVNALPVIIENIVKTLTSTKFITMMIRATIELFMALVKAIPQIIGSLVGALGRILKVIGDTLSPSNLARIGGDMIKGLWNGISDLAGWIGQKIKGFGEGVLNGVKSFFGINSPSKVFAGIGRDLDRGLAQGITKNTGIVTGAIDDMANSALGAMTMNPTVDATMSTASSGTAPYSPQSGVAGEPKIQQNNNIYNQVDLDAVTRDLAWQVRR